MTDTDAAQYKSISIARALVNGKPQLVLPGNGDCARGGAQDLEAIFACLADKLEMPVAGLEATNKVVCDVPFLPE